MRGSVGPLALFPAATNDIHIRSGLVSVRPLPPQRKPTQLRALSDIAERKGKGDGELARYTRQRPKTHIPRALGEEGRCQPVRSPCACLRFGSRMTHLGKVAGQTGQGAGPRGPDARKPCCPSHYLLIPPSCFHSLCFLLNSLPRLKVSISGLGPKVTFFGNFQLSSFSYC